MLISRAGECVGSMMLSADARRAPLHRFTAFNMCAKQLNSSTSAVSTVVNSVGKSDVMRRITAACDSTQHGGHVSEGTANSLMGTDSVKTFNRDVRSTLQMPFTMMLVHSVSTPSTDSGKGDTRSASVSMFRR